MSAIYKKLLSDCIYKHITRDLRSNTNKEYSSSNCSSVLTRYEDVVNNIYLELK